jgi:Zn-dependent peptidase ImmA (M78 family)/plasmid maintenance system antidote protein VapI
MERIQTINPTRVQWCCDDRGITPQELADAVAIPEAALDKMMAGEEGLTFPQLQRIAKFFHRGVLFFLELEPVNEEQIHTPQFRTITNQLPNLDAKTKALIERVEKQRAIFLSLREELGDAEQDRFAAPVLTKNDPKQAAAAAREWLELGAKNTFETYRRAVEDRGILVFRTNGYNGAWQIEKESPIIGFSLFDLICPAIVVKKQAHESRQTFTLMHELAHILLHQSSFIDQEADLTSSWGNEQQANAFAGYLLVPDTFLAEIEDKQRPGNAAEYEDWLDPFRKAWGVSTEVILRRLLDTGRLSSGDYGAYREWTRQRTLTDTGGGTRQYRYREPKHIFGEPFVRTVLDALSAQQISLAKASTYLDNLKIKDVHQLERYIAGL